METKVMFPECRGPVTDVWEAPDKFGLRSLPARHNVVPR